jgi:hypothetical protein
MPKVPSISIKTKPKRFINKDGSYSKLGMDWIKLLSEKGLPLDYDGEVEIITGYEEGNPNSTDQKKDWLYSLGWVPRTFKEKKDKETGEVKQIPQINLDQGKGICESIKEMYDKCPDLELLEGLSVLQHRIGILKGFLRDQQDGWLQAKISGFTNTLRVKHTEIVNLPKPEKLFAAPIRGALVADEGFELCGSDMKSLEDRIKMHYIYPLDPKYVESMSTDDWDPHLEIAKIAGMLSQDQVDKYKSGVDKSIKPIRDIAKNCGYACQYGAGINRLMTTGGIERGPAQRLHESYWRLNWSVKKVAEDQLVKTVDDQMWLYNPVSKMWYTLRYDKDRFSTLVQSTAAFVFDLWIKYVLEQREQLTASFHDEGVWHLKEGHREEFTDIIQKAIQKVNEEVKLNRELEVDIQFGKAYSSIH